MNSDQAPEQVNQEQKIAQSETAVNADSTTNTPDNKPEIKTPENENNWRAFRERRETERKEREQAIKYAAEEKARADALKAALEAATSRPTQPVYAEENEEDSLQKKIDIAVEQRLQKERKIYQQEQEEKERRELPNRIQQTMPDFQTVCSAENTDYLEFHYPEVASAFKYMPEGYEKWNAVYRAVKRFVPNPDSRKDQSRADRNVQKPGSISSPGAAQGSATMSSVKLDESRKAANWERMQKTLKGLSS